MVPKKNKLWTIFRFIHAQVLLIVCYFIKSCGRNKKCIKSSLIFNSNLKDLHFKIFFEPLTKSGAKKTKKLIQHGHRTTAVILEFPKTRAIIFKTNKNFHKCGFAQLFLLTHYSSWNKLWELIIHSSICIW